jgi:hypothetical protein
MSSRLKKLTDTIERDGVRNPPRIACHTTHTLAGEVRRQWIDERGWRL